MQGFLMQDWTTLRLNFGQLSLIQTEASWLDLQGYQDVVFWLEVREASFATGVTSFTFAYETSPIKDESMFKAMVSSSVITAALASPDVKSVTLASAVPLARFARWKLVPNAAGSAGVSDITFRLAAAANMVGGK